ncbi:MAG: enoyl-CoA hydratase/isomerase family protein [Chloroflexi bacterium]|nr:enoyl-CoA hydratase/isomerase family protein [Chloroflexota bacterium]
MEYEDIVLAKKDGIATITLDRPERMNAFTAGMKESLPLAIDEVRRNDDLKVLVLTGAGRGFCTGADVGDLGSRAVGSASTPYDRRNYILGVQRLVLALRGLDKPTIAMVNGPAVGAGCDLALGCDMRIASENARFGEVYIKLGVVPGNGGMYFLPRLAGVAKACELIFTGEIIDAREAERIGLVNKVVPAAELEAETMRLAARIAAGPPIAMRLAKIGIYECLTRDLASSLDYSALAMGIAQSTEDHREGTTAFKEKRPPVFRGR